MKIFLMVLITISLYSNELKIKANSFESDQKKGISVFSGNVNILRENDEINASKITVYTNSENKPKEYIAKGNVSFSITTQSGDKYNGVFVPLLANLSY